MMKPEPARAQVLRSAAAPTLCKPADSVPSSTVGIDPDASACLALRIVNQPQRRCRHSPSPSSSAAERPRVQVPQLPSHRRCAESVGSALASVRRDRDRCVCAPRAAHRRPAASHLHVGGIGGSAVAEPPARPWAMPSCGGRRTTSVWIGQWSTRTGCRQPQHGVRAHAIIPGASLLRSALGQSTRRLELRPRAAAAAPRRRTAGDRSTSASRCARRRSASTPPPATPPRRPRPACGQPAGCLLAAARGAVAVG